MSKKTTKEDRLSSIDQKLDNLTSLKKEFVRGVVRGVGTALGASVIGAVAIWLIFAVFNTVDDVPIVEDLVNKINLKEAVDRAP